MEEAINLANWDLFLYTRSFPSMDSDRSLRHVSKMLTFPVTVASVMHELSPYKVGKDLTPEGLRSLAALRMTLYPQIATTKDGLVLTSSETLRVFVVGARSEAMLPAHVWVQLSYIFPKVSIQIHFVGPETFPRTTQSPSAPRPQKPCRSYSTTRSTTITTSTSGHLMSTKMSFSSFPQGLATQTPARHGDPRSRRCSRPNVPSFSLALTKAT